MDELEARLIPGSEASLTNPFFSPDGQSVGYWDAASSRLMRIDIEGGTPVAIGPSASLHSATWTRDGTVLFSQAAQGIFRVSANGGTPELVIRLNAGEEADSPQLLPDGDTVLFSVTTPAGRARWDQADIVAQSIRTGHEHGCCAAGATLVTCGPGIWFTYSGVRCSPSRSTRIGWWCGRCCRRC